MNRIKLLISIFATVLSLLLAGCEDSGCEDPFNKPPLKYGSIIDGFEKMKEINFRDLQRPFICQKQKGKWFIESDINVCDIPGNGKVTIGYPKDDFLFRRDRIVNVYFNPNNELLAKIKKGYKITFCGRMNSEGALSSCWFIYEYYCGYCDKKVYSIKDLGDDNMVKKYFKQFEKEEGICPNAPNIKHLKHNFIKGSDYTGIRDENFKVITF